ncbi:phosphatidylserine decarboxylase [Aestuariimicrobium soli]|uniref:phosphatidylserine decarboxylase n=1 Tax=Aestuariimicrobium soli TaxID=2035834 RepID=UPI003EC0FDD7
MTDEATPTLVRDRRTGRLLPERQFADAGLRLLHGRLRGLLPLVTHPWFSELAAIPRRLPGSRRGIDGFVRSFGIDLTDFEPPADGWRSFAEFFVRRFAPGARPVPADERLLLSPADGKLRVAALDGHRLRVKSHELTVTELLGDAEVAAQFEDGTAVVVRLTVDDAHRFSHPVSGRVVRAATTRRLLHTVGPLGTAPFLVTNSRRWVLVDSPVFGRVCLVAVGALLVGRIDLATGPRAVRGEEAGRFELGGSTLVLLLEPGRISLDADLVDSPVETRVLAHEPIGRAHA